MLYQFSQTMYFQQVKKFKLRPAPGYRKNARDLKFVFEVYERGPGGGLVRCEAERIAQSVRLIHSDDGRWSPADEDDELLLEALGLPPRLNCGDDLKLALIGRWIEGRPGPPGPDGLNPLAEVRSTRQEAATVPISAPNAPQRPVTHRDARPLDSPLEQDDPEPDVPERAPGPESPRIEPCLNASLRYEIGVMKPRWDAVLRVLTWNNANVVAYARLAPNQAMILSAFEEEGWPTRIDDPLPRGQLRQTLKDLQKKFKDAPITFRADGTGEGILWTIGQSSPTHLSRRSCRPLPAHPAT